MNRFWRVSLLLACALSLGAAPLSDARIGEAADASSAPAANAAAPSAGQSAESKRLWSEVKAALRRGDYAQARQRLQELQAITPDDPQVALYQALCEERLESAQTFRRLTPGEAGALQERLRQEERAQKREAGRQKIVERQLQHEQQRWDRDIEVTRRQLEREAKVKRKAAQAQAVKDARAAHAARRDRAKQDALQRAQAQAAQRDRARHEAVQRAQEQAASQEASPEPGPAKPEPSVPAVSEPPAPPEAPETAPAIEAPPPAGLESPEPPAGQPLLPRAGDGREAVELAPVTVATPEEVLTPSLAGRTPPPAGAVQINANQMSVSPDQKIAMADGDVEVVFENAILTCDHLTLFTDTKDVYAEGRVRLEQGNQVFRGELVHYNFQSKKGRFLQGTVSSPPWHEHGRSVEHVAEGVYQVTPGYLTSCDLEPPHFKFSGKRAIVFADDKLARMRNVALFVDRVPFFYLPWVIVADRQSPFFIIPGKKKPWEQFALMGYRYEWPENHKGTLRLDWRNAFGWAVGIDHRFEDPRAGKGLVKLYFNEERNIRRPKSELPKGADIRRYRALWRHVWQPVPDTTVITDIQEYSDVDFRKELLFREEFVNDDHPDSFVSLVKNAPEFTVSGLVRKRMNRFQGVTEAFPDLSISTRQQRIGDTPLFSTSGATFSNLQSKTAHSEEDADVVRAGWSQGLRYALNWFRPIEVTPNVSVSETYYTKDKQGGAERPQGRRDVLSGQFGAGMDASLKLFRLFPVVTNAFGLNINKLRHVLTPTVTHSYVHRPTVPDDLLSFPNSSTPTNNLTMGLENKLQTKRPDKSGELQSIDLARLLIALPYTFRGNHNKRGGELGNWSFDVELYPWPWLRMESDWSYPSHYTKGTQDERLTGWNFDMVMVGGKGEVKAQDAPDIQAPQRKTFEPGAHGSLAGLTLPQGQWYLGLGHRYAHNDKTEDIVQYDIRLSEKWEIGTFHRMTWKEVASPSKRFNHLREYQYILRRDLHDWIGELIYRVDREFGEELFLTFTLKAYPEMPVELETGYHRPKLGSQSDPFSPLRAEHKGS